MRRVPSQLVGPLLFLPPFFPIFRELFLYMLLVHNLSQERETMDMTIVLVAFALAMDSFSVSITNGLATKTFKVGDALKIGIFFGAFQAIMPRARATPNPRISF